MKVWTRMGGSNSVILHTDPDCSRLANAKDVRSHPREAYPDDHPVCEWCKGTQDEGGSTDEHLSKKLREL